jgi:HEPN domain-containing protein
MPPDRLPPDDPREWLNRSHSDLALAQVQVSDVRLEDLCFHAQQAVEKSLKALLLHRKIRFPYVHNLSELMSLLEKDGLNLPEFVCEAARLTEYAVEARYPGLGEPIMPDEYQEAIFLAKQVMDWVEGLIK